MEQTKITVKIYTKLLNSFNNNLRNCFIKRDAYLNYVISQETPKLAEDMDGLKLTNPARQYIAGELKRLGTTKVNITIDKDTAEKLNLVINKSNMVRDAFINRLIIFLNASENLLEQLELPINPNKMDESDYIVDSMSTAPISNINYFVSDPFLFLRPDIEEFHNERFYLYVLPKQMLGMYCYIDDTYVPGTEAYLKKTKKDSKLFLTL